MLQQQTNNSTVMNLFHSLLLEEMADLETLQTSMSFNDTTNSVSERNRFHEAFANIFPNFNFDNQHPSVNPKYIQNPVNVIPSYKIPDKFLYPTYHTNHEEVLSRLGNDTSEKMEYPCDLISNEESETYQDIAFILELIIQPLFICIGFLFNLIAISVLRR